jgi:hypothetical protein
MPPLIEYGLYTAQDYIEWFGTYTTELQLMYVLLIINQSIIAFKGIPNFCSGAALQHCWRSDLIGLR